MHHKIKEALVVAAQVGVVTFTTVEGNTVTTRRQEIQKLEYVEDSGNCHIAKVGGKLYNVKYAQLQKLRVFLASKKVSPRSKKSLTKRY